jgi:hypothetical protein
VHKDPLADRFENEYGMFEAKGGFKTIGASPHELEMVKVPVLGGSVTEIFPLTLYC